MRLERPAKSSNTRAGLAKLVSKISIFAFVLALASGCASHPKPQPDFALMSEAWNTIQKRYIDHSAIQPTELTYGAISGMVEALGDTGHSTFLTPTMAREIERIQRGEFKGVGIEIQIKSGHVVIVAPLDDSPAQRAGIKAGDIILKINGQDITDWQLSRVVEKISGKAGTKVTLTLEEPRTSRSREVTLVRASIKLHQITWQRLPGTKVAHLRIATFDAGVTRDLRKALNDIEHEGLEVIILDLRNNPGGLLDEAIGVVSQFLDEGSVLLAKDAKGNTEPVPVRKGGVATDVPVVVLVNEGSASAAEIVAGAVQDAQRGELVGETTFGTGTVLSEFRLSDGSALLLAVEEWLTPKGRSFWHKGLQPDVVVALAPEAAPLLPSSEKGLTEARLQASEDRQLLRALALAEHSVRTKAAATAPRGAASDR